MPTIPACVQVKLLIATRFDTLGNMLYYEGSPAPTASAHLIQIANGLFDHIKAQVAALYGTNSLVTAMQASYQNGGGSAIEVQTSAAPAAGTISESLLDDDPGSADELASETAVIFKKLTGLPGRKNRGRWFFGGCGEAVNYAGVVDVAYHTAALALCGVLASDVTVASGGGYAGGVWHARHWNRKDNVLVPIQVVKCDTVLGTRRDRRAPRPLNLTVV